MASESGGGGGALRSYLAPSLLAAAVASLLRSRSFFFANARGGSGDEDEAILLHALAGALGSALSITLLYPLETVRTRVQVDDGSAAPRSSVWLACEIGKREGVRGLYKGWHSLVVALMALNFVYFYGFRMLRLWVGNWSKNEGGWMAGWMRQNDDGLGNNEGPPEVPKVAVDLIAGYLAGCAAVLATGPLWLVNTRLKLQGVNVGQSDNNGNGNQPTGATKRYNGILHCLYSISNEEGVLTLWHGTFASLVLACNPAIQLGVYELLKRRHLLVGAIGVEEGGKHSLEHFSNALVAKFLATIATYPLQVLQTRHRAGMATTATKGTGGSSSGWSDALRRSYRGLESKLLQTCLNSALMFAAYERLVDVLREAAFR